MHIYIVQPFYQFILGQISSKYSKRRFANDGLFTINVSEPFTKTLLSLLVDIWLNTTDWELLTKRGVVWWT